MRRRRRIKRSYRLRVMSGWQPIIRAEGGGGVAIHRTRCVRLCTFVCMVNIGSQLLTATHVPVTNPQKEDSLLSSITRFLSIESRKAQHAKKVGTCTMICQPALQEITSAGIPERLLRFGLRDALAALNVTFVLVSPVSTLDLKPSCSVRKRGRDGHRHRERDRWCMPDEALGLLGAEPDVHPKDSGHECQRYEDERVDERDGCDACCCASLLLRSRTPTRRRCGLLDADGAHQHWRAVDW